MKLLKLIKQKPGMWLLIAILAIISVVSVKPNFYLLGWDNFSSYLGSVSNIFDTLFATWRGYRGMGVPSDGEVNDIFRQVFDALVGLAAGKKVADQLYLLVMLWGGVLMMYGLGRKISRMLAQDETRPEWFGFVAAFFYLFNLNTLAVFYFPMIMYNTRFLMLPTTVYVLLELMGKAKISARKYAFYLTLIFIGFGSYMVPTIFIVMMLMLGLMLVVFKRFKRLVMSLIFYMALGAYWLLPFANYTKQKAEIVPQAPTFMEINEAMLNKPRSYYAFEKQAKLRPNFFESNFTNRETNLPQAFHPLAVEAEKGIVRWVLWIFPGLYLMGIAYVLVFKRERILVWLALTALAFLLLSMKEYSPVGWLYQFIFDKIPFADTVFRFGDTKFHAMIAFSGSILAAVMMTQIARFKRLVALAIGVIILLHLWVYKGYFNGNLVGFFMYNKIPDAYFEIAKVINSDSQEVRVVHLPLDEHAYWKPYRWGYFGSAFFNFMINKPLFDRSFEPASIENADVHQRLLDIVHLAGSVREEVGLEGRAVELYELLKSLSVKYVVDDQTVSPYVDARNIEYWGKINPIDSGRVIQAMEQKGYLKLVSEYLVSPQDYAQEYARLYPYNQASRDNYTYKIRLYQLVEVEPRVQFLSEADKVDSQHLAVPLKNHYVQAEEFDAQALVYPFSLENPQVEIDDGQVKIITNGVQLGLPVSESKYTEIIDLNSDEMAFRYDEACNLPGKSQKVTKTESGVTSLVSGCRNFAQKQISFASDKFYLWSVAYQRLSGATPALILAGKLDEYSFKKLYLPQDVKRVSGFLKPRADLQDYGDKQLIIQHYSENEGEIELKQVALVELPNEWVDMKIVPSNYQPLKFANDVQLVEYRQILPSLWQVKAQAQAAEVLVKFNEQYDKQWKAWGVPVEWQARCDGYANCYKIKVPGGGSTFYFFYVPELFSLVGLMVSVMAVVAGKCILTDHSGNAKIGEIKKVSP